MRWTWEWMLRLRWTEPVMWTPAEETTYYVDSARLLPTGPAPMTRWRKRLFGFMARNASAATDFFNIPPTRVVELGARIEF